MPRQRKSQPPQAEAQWHQRAKLIEEFAALDREIDNFKPKIFRHSKLRELIIGWYPAAAPEEEVLVLGVNCDIVISARDQIRSVTQEGKAKLFRLWGSKNFIARCAMHLKSLPDPKDELGLYTVQALTGPRHLRVQQKAQPAANPAA